MTAGRRASSEPEGSLPKPHARARRLVGTDEDHAGGFQSANDIGQRPAVGLSGTPFEIDEGLLRDAGRFREIGLAHVQQAPRGLALLP